MTKYKLNRGSILKDGHTMFFEDVVRELNGIQALRNKIKELRSEMKMRKGKNGNL